MQSGFARAKWLYSSNVMYSVKSGCIRANLLYAGKVVVVGQNWL